MSNDPSSGTQPPAGFMSWASQFFQEAVTKVQTTVENYTTAKDTYLLELVKAESRVNTLRGKPGIDGRFGEIEAKLNAAKQAAGNSEYIEANKHLVPVLALHPDADQQSTDYVWNQANQTNVADRVSVLRGHAGSRAITIWFGEIETSFNEATAATLLLDHTLACAKLQQSWNLHRDTSNTDLAWEMAEACENYDLELSDVEDRLNDLNTHVGEKAIALERSEIEAKLNEAKAKATTNDFVDAYALLMEAYQLHDPEAEDLADKCEGYFDKKTDWDVDISDLETEPQAVVIADEIAKLKDDLLGINARAEAKQWKVLDGLLDEINDRFVDADELREKSVNYEADYVIKKGLVTGLESHISTHKRADSIAAEIVLLNGTLTAATGLADIATREYDEAMLVLADIPKRCDAAKRIADACELYETTLLSATEKLTAAKLLPGIEKETDSLDNKMQRAATAATNDSRKFAEAQILLDEVIAGCVTATTLSGELLTFGTATGDAIKLGTIKDASAELKKQVAAVRALLPQIVGLPSHAKIQKQLGEIDVLIDAIPADTTEKPNVALKIPSEQCDAANLAIRRIIDLGYAEARKEAVGKMTPLDSRCKDTPLAPKAAEIKTVSLAASDLKATTEDYTAAMELLAKVTAECAALTLIADKMDKYTTDQPGLEIKVNDLEPKRPQIGTEIDDLKKLLTEAKDKADLGDYAAAVAKLEEIQTGLTLTDKLADVKSKIATPPTNDLEFEALKTSCISLMAQPGGAAKVDAIVAAMPAKVQRFVMMAVMMARFDLDEFKQFKSDMIWDCPWTPCTGRNYQDDTHCSTCSKTRKFWMCGHDPCNNMNSWDVAVCEACGLDDAGCTDDEAKIESSYETKNLESDDLTMGNKSLKRLYEVFKMVPDSQTKDNDKLKKVIRYKQDTDGAAYGDDTIYMHCGRAGDDGSSDYAEELLPGSPMYEEYFPAPDPSAPDGDARKDVYQMDPKCQPKPGTVDPGKKKPYFDFATLHEIGHAVDDKKKFMAKNGSKDEYGGWINYGGDVTKVAKIANDHFKFNQAYIEERLSGNTPNLPDLVVDARALTDQQWLDLQTKVNDWCDGIKMDKDLWWDGSNSARLSIAGRVYQEAYEGSWVSYKLSARNQGIHGYQFRAPGEWFAELYAAYHSKILKDDHPCDSWLSKL